MTVSEVITIILELIGGLACFLYGMHAMSDSIEKTAGARLRSILMRFTSNQFKGIIVGTVFTALLQSSSACTSMVVSFVDNGLMTLYQAVGLIFGANIGTAVTSQLVSFKLDRFAPIFLALGVIMTLFIKRTKVNKLGEIVIGFGILFLGIFLMGQAIDPLKDSPAIHELFASLESPILAVFIGWLVTTLIQSSSLTVSIILLLASRGMFDHNLQICLFIILGCNVGGCMTALLTSLSGRKDAKRAAMIHLLFNLISGTVFFILMMFFDKYIVTLLYEIISRGNPGKYIANSHILIKLFQVIIMMPFAGLLVKLTYIIIPGEEKQKVGYGDTFKLQFIGNHVVFNPATAVVLAQNEIERMASLASDNLNRAMNALITMDQDSIKEVWKVEENIDFLSHSITDYLVRLTQSTMPVEDLQNIGSLFHVVNDIERIGDHATNIAESAQLKKDKSITFSKDAMKDLTEMMETVNTNLHLSIEMLSSRSYEHLKDVEELEEKTDRMERSIQDAHIDRMSRGECSPEAGIIFNEIVTGLERVCDHATNIAYAASKSIQ